MLYGLPPFYDTNVNKMYQKIAHDPLRFRDEPPVSEAAKDMLRKMLDRRISTRLGSGPTGAEEIKQAPFFAQNIDFAKVLAKQYVPEFRPPAMRSETDVRNFDTGTLRGICARCVCVATLFLAELTSPPHPSLALSSSTQSLLVKSPPTVSCPTPCPTRCRPKATLKVSHSRNKVVVALATHRRG